MVHFFDIFVSLCSQTVQKQLERTLHNIGENIGEDQI